MKNNKNQSTKPSTSVEFGSEFVDVNASKWMESLQSQNKQKKENKKNEC
ncbi:hypothetical protein [Mangrovibacillus cuniculi]|uniref:Uncharacterized protein n=1 Tax=Mangrovibacillus cuniculi TaxID=2593652 RepID=A0A7S8CA14_9BACI|nr:hypothetical protein [Mangrovibacillus cuniculi]QPC46128.1 hypothetical protein G8O30_03720 [Mangrovibacillus cuniculi]